MACTARKEPSGPALSASTGRYSRRCAGRAALPATASHPARAAAAPSPSSAPDCERRASLCPSSA